MKARLFSPAPSLRVDHEFTDEVTVGRGAKNSLSLSSRLLSAYHARIAWDETLGCYRLQDMGSTNGTRLDGRRVEDALLGHLHVVTLADQLDIVFQDLERCAARRQAREAEGPQAGGGKGEAEGPPLSDKTQHTSIQSLALALPELLRAPGAQAAPATKGRPAKDGPDRGGPGQDGPGQDGPVTDGTLLERLPLPLPSFLQKAGAGAEDEVPAPPGERPPGDQGPAPSSVMPPSSSESASRPTVDWSAIAQDADKDADEDATAKAPADEEPAAGAPAEQQPAGQRDVFYLASRSPAGTIHYELREGINLIGRSLDAEVRIDSPEVSRHHAQLTLRDGRMMLRDLGSRNRTFVGGEPLAEEAVNVMPGERLRFGALEVVIGVTAGERPDQGTR